MPDGFTPQRVTDLISYVRASTQKQLIRLTYDRTTRNQQAIVRAFGQEAPTQRWVDGVLGKPVTQAQEVTLTRFTLFSNIIDVAMKMLFQRSPYGPEKDGHYRDDHWLFVNDIRRDATNEGQVVQIMPGDQVVIINMRPYARKIEGGARSRYSNRLTDRRPGLSVQAPNGVYEITARDLQRMFGTIATIRFTYRGMMGSGLAPSAAAGPRAVVRNVRGRFMHSGGPRPGNRGADRFPALEIELKGAV